MRQVLLSAILASVVAFGVAGYGMVGAAAQDIRQASFNSDGQVNIPTGWREWVFVGTPLTPNALNGGSAPFPEFHNVYIEPSAYAHWKKTGEFAEGTQIAKELVFIRTKDKDEMNPDGSTNEVSGVGYFQGEFTGLELTVKDTKRFASEPGGWAYFSFGHDVPYAKTAKAFPTESCNACHQGAAADDFVFTQFYPVLRAAKPQ
ncbi:MAG: cytochrome P460 family protein [Alphaproteobacteria bacterium]|jgi:hypothetical protein